jgi:hypothetical protein
MSQALLFEHRPRIPPRPGTSISCVVARAGNGVRGGKGTLIHRAGSIAEFATELRRDGIACSRESIGRAIRTGEQYLGLYWFRERRPK